MRLARAALSVVLADAVDDELLEANPVAALGPKHARR